MFDRWFAFALVAVGLFVALIGERRDERRWVWIGKPAASAGFVWIALICGARESAFGQAVLVALLFSWLGDVLLIPRGHKAAFVTGIAAFLLAHVAYACAFVIAGAELWTSLVAFFVVLVPSGAALRWLWPHVSRRMRAPVSAYVLAISVMLALSIGAAGASPNGMWRVAGTVCFYLSDLSVARDRFVAREFVNRLWGLPLYYAAQALLATSVS